MPPSKDYPVMSCSKELDGQGLEDMTAHDTAAKSTTATMATIVTTALVPKMEALCSSQGDSGSSLPTPMPPQPEKSAVISVASTRTCKCRGCTRERKWEEMCACCGVDLPVPSAPGDDDVCDKCALYLANRYRKHSYFLLLTLFLPRCLPRESYVEA